MTPLLWILFLLPALGSVPVVLRWLLVAQREHYIPGSAVRFAARWTRASALNLALGVALISLVVGAWLGTSIEWLFTTGTALVAVAWPVGLPMRGMAWTPRLRRVAAMWLLLSSGVVTGAVLLFGPRPGLSAGIAVSIGLSEVVVDLSLWLLRPLETRLQRQWVEKARAKLRSVGPRVVAITGSYGKTTAKEYVRRVLSLSGTTLASPASFNNAMGLSRAVNEHLAAGTKWFVAEMGTYGLGEISALCEWISPDIAAITAIGPVHLERFGSLEVTVAAKAEIAERARVVVLNCDDDRLADLAETLSEHGKEVIRCGTREGFDVVVGDGGDRWTITVGGVARGTVARVAFPTNLAVAVGIGLAADVPLAGLTAAFADAEAPMHRQSVTKGQAGFWIIDDTFNSNPAGATAALETLARLDTGRKVVVTPGMVELGKEQKAANRAFASHAAQVADDVLIVKESNRRALVAGASEHRARVETFPDREAAVEWVRANLGPGDAVLYENDLPAHYP